MNVFASLRRNRSLVAPFIALALTASAHAASLVTNGNFSNTLSAYNSFQMGYNGVVAGWSNVNSSSNYNFLYANGSPTAQGQYGAVSLYGPPSVSPAGGNYIAMDTDFQTSAIQQTLNGLIDGQQYTVSFYFGAGQQTGFSGSTHETMQVTLGNQTLSTAEIFDPSQSFTGWYSESLTFTANGGTVGSTVNDTLSFLGVGGSDNPALGNVPSFALLDGVSVAAGTPPAVPEPSSLMLLGTGLASLGGLVRSKLAKKA